MPKAVQRRQPNIIWMSSLNNAGPPNSRWKAAVHSQTPHCKAGLSLAQGLGQWGLSDLSCPSQDWAEEVSPPVLQEFHSNSLIHPSAEDSGHVPMCACFSSRHDVNLNQMANFWVNIRNSNQLTRKRSSGCWGADTFRGLGYLIIRSICSQQIFWSWGLVWRKLIYVVG